MSTFCIADEAPINQLLCQLGFFVVGKKQCQCRSISIAPECVAILVADSKRSFWAAWTVMNNCRSQFGWQCALLKESAIRRVVERQVTRELPVHVVLVPPLLVAPLLVPPLLVAPLLVPPLLVTPLLVAPLLVPPLLVTPLLVTPLLVPPLLVPPLLVPPLLVAPLLRLQALLPMVQRQPHRVCYFLDCPRKFRLRSLWWLQKKHKILLVPATAWSSRRLILLSFFCITGSSHTSADVYPTDTSQ